MKNMKIPWLPKRWFYRWVIFEGRIWRGTQPWSVRILINIIIIIIIHFFKKVFRGIYKILYGVFYTAPKDCPRLSPCVLHWCCNMPTFSIPMTNRSGHWITPMLAYQQVYRSPPVPGKRGGEDWSSCLHGHTNRFLFWGYHLSFFFSVSSARQ